MRAMHLIGLLNMGNRPLSHRRTHGSIVLLGETRVAGERCLLSTREKPFPFKTRKSSNASTSCMMHFSGIKSIPS